MKLDVLAIGAHPDDVEISCSGTIVKLVKQGRKVGICDLTEGELGTRGSREIRAEEAKAASGILGITARVNLRIPDGNVEISHENRLRLIRVIRHFRPEILLIPYWMERHPDHERAHRLSREAWFYSGLEKIRTVDNKTRQEPYRAPRYYMFMQAYEFTPSFIVDISSEFDRRMEAVRAFASQFHNPLSTERETSLSRPEFLDMLRTRFEYFGSRIGRKYGEPFLSVEAVGIDDVLALVR